MLIPPRFVAAMGVAIVTTMSLSTARAQDAVTDGGVFVDLQSHDRSVRIDMVMGDGTTSPMCSVPCGKALPRQALYVIHGDGLAATTPFLLPSDRSDLTLSVRPGSRAGRITGMTLVAIGAAAIAVGFMLAPGDPPQDAAPQASHPWAPIAGLAGIGLAGLGAVIWWKSETRIWSSSGRTFSEAPRAARKAPALALTARGLEF